MRLMNGFEKRKNEKMKSIMEAAFELFNQHGINDVKITDIAQKANVSKVSIYNYFGSKEELARQIMYDYMDKKAESLKVFMESDLSFDEKFSRLYKENMSVPDELSDGMINHTLISSPEVQKFLYTYYQSNIKPVIINFIEQGKREGKIDPEISTESILLYMESFNGILSTQLSMKQRTDLGKLFFHGFRGK